MHRVVDESICYNGGNDPKNSMSIDFAVTNRFLQEVNVPIWNSEG